MRSRSTNLTISADDYVVGSWDSFILKPAKKNALLSFPRRLIAHPEISRPISFLSAKLFAALRDENKIKTD